MTRETKIGLLVGLAFIIVIGILLSDHMTSTTQPPQALLEGGANVREGVVAPAPSQPAPPPVTAVRKITPPGVVPAQGDLRPPPPPQPLPPAPVAYQHVQVGGPAGGAPAADPIIIRGSGNNTGGAVGYGQPQAPPEPVTDVIPLGPIAEPSDAGQIGDGTAELQQWARDTRRPTGPPVGEQVEPQAPPVVVTPQHREYVAQSGDNLSRLASAMLGANTKANRDAIVRVNPALQKNPDLVVEGRKYKVPTAADRAAAAPAPAPAPAPVAQVVPPAAPAEVAGGTSDIPDTVPVVRRGSPIPVTELVDPLPAPARRNDGTTVYVAKDGDTLWGIASKHLGSGAEWPKVQQLNSEVLSGGETVVAGMRLRLPARAVTSARD